AVAGFRTATNERQKGGRDSGWTLGLGESVTVAAASSSKLNGRERKTGGGDAEEENEGVGGVCSGVAVAGRLLLVG
uniref:Uncharacterized protein n=1 Tax=Cucumis melo TaxID=3656 RepID=A0A9I9CCS7_CUCME